MSKNKLIFLCFIILTIFTVLYFSIHYKSSFVVSTLNNLLSIPIQNASENSASPTPIIVIDAGHGGADPGKVGVAGTLEKDINLKIALYLQEILTAQDIQVVMTRETDIDLATASEHWKLSDMKQRLSQIPSNTTAVISIHQNSYTDPQIYGAQCFYHTPSKESKQLATLLQKQIITSTQQTKLREIKGNADYYLLKHSPVPTVIVECGFLSNPEEERLLLTEDYQRKMAWAIHLGLLKYLKTQERATAK